MTPHWMTSWARILAITALLPALAWAQEGPGDRRVDIDPDFPVDQGGVPTALHAWNLMKVSGLHAGSTLGPLWAEANDNVYVWATRRFIGSPLGMHSPGMVVPEDPMAPVSGPGGRLLVHSTLMRWDGGTWSVALDLPGETPASVFGVGQNVFAATNAVDGTPRLYHFHGNHWEMEPLPAAVAGPAGAIVGDRTRVFFRAGNAILEGNGRNWRVVYMSEALIPGNALVFLDRDQILAPSCSGQAIWNGVDWNWIPNAEVVHMRGGWGGRDADGELHLFSTGSDVQSSGMCIWQYVERAPGSLHGTYVEVVETPGPGGPNVGSGVGAWGSGVHDVYVIGVVQGRGSLMRFNGLGWKEIYPMADMPEPTSVYGTPRGDVWIALRDGRVLFGERREPLPSKVAPMERMAIDPAMPGRIAVRREAPRAYVLEYGLPDERDVAIGVFDVTGRRVAMLERARHGAGMHRVRWNAQDVRPGVYFCHVRAGTWTAGQRIVVDR